MRSTAEHVLPHVFCTLFLWHFPFFLLFRQWASLPHLSWLGQVPQMLARLAGHEGVGVGVGGGDERGGGGGDAFVFHGGGGEVDVGVGCEVDVTLTVTTLMPKAWDAASAVPSLEESEAFTSAAVMEAGTVMVAVMSTLSALSAVTAMVTSDLSTPATSATFSCNLNLSLSEYSLAVSVSSSSAS